eukprot:TRINITY_DN1015_c0_g1_i1.p1 TRINITY_DN1015_c0_g1~~TRINITY_DN1015_c0_g1_i1.p1  ORF type:complete len:977 (+),score=328.01 TRINITY_DN1015_c0_g1_i1:51-2981(+)
MPLRGKAKRFGDHDKSSSDAWVIPEGNLGTEVNGRAAIVAGRPHKSVWTCEKEGALSIRSCRTGSLVRSITRKHIFPWSLAEGPLGRYVWVGYSDGAVILFSTAPPHDQVKVLQVGGLGGCYCVVPHLNWMFAGYGNSQIIKWNGLTLERDGVYVGHQSGQGSAIRDICLNDADLYTCGDDATIRKWDVVTCEETSVFKGHSAAILSITYSRKNHLWSTGEDSTVRVWDPKTMKCIKTHKLESPSSVLKFMGNRVWCGCWKKTIVIFDAVTLERVGHYHNHKAPIAEVLTVSASRLYKVWTYGIDRVVNVWTMEGDDSEYDQERRMAELRMFDLEAENRRLLRDLQAALEDADNMHKITPSELLDAQKAAEELQYLLNAQRDENNSLKTLIRERNQNLCARFVKMGWLKQLDLLRRYYYKLQLYSQQHCRQQSAKTRSAAELAAAERARKLAKVQANYLRLKERLPDTLLLLTRSSLMTRYYYKLQLYAQERVYLAELDRVKAQHAETLAARHQQDLLRRFWDRLRENMRARQKAQMRREHEAEVAAMKETYQLREDNAKRAAHAEKRKVQGFFCDQLRAVLGNDLRRRYYYKWMAFHVARENEARYQSAVNGGLKRLGDRDQVIADIKKNHALKSRKQREKAMTALAQRCKAQLLERYYYQWLAMLCKRRPQGYAVRILNQKANNKLLNRYYQRLIVFWGLRVREKADEKVRKQGELVRELKDLKSKMDALEKQLLDAKALLDQAQLDSELWEAKYRNADAEAARLSQELEDTKAAYRAMEDRISNQAKFLRERPFHLAAACEVYRAIADSIEAVELHSQEVNRREQSKTELLNALSGVRKRAVGAKKKQIDCIMMWFSEEERLSGNVHTLIYGHRHDVSCKKCGPAYCPHHRVKSVSAGVRNPPVRPGSPTPNTARAYSQSPSTSPRAGSRGPSSARGNSSARAGSSSNAWGSPSRALPPPPLRYSNGKLENGR